MSDNQSPAHVWNMRRRWRNDDLGRPNRIVRPNWTYKLSRVDAHNECAFRSICPTGLSVTSRRRLYEVKNSLTPHRRWLIACPPVAPAFFRFVCKVHTCSSDLPRLANLLRLKRRCSVHSICTGRLGKWELSVGFESMGVARRSVQCRDFINPRYWRV